jgi:hypothetical protein
MCATVATTTVQTGYCTRPLTRLTHDNYIGTDGVSSEDSYKYKKMILLTVCMLGALVNLFLNTRWLTWLLAFHICTMVLATNQKLGMMGIRKIANGYSTDGCSLGGLSSAVSSAWRSPVRCATEGENCFTVMSSHFRDTCEWRLIGSVIFIDIDI